MDAQIFQALALLGVIFMVGLLIVVTAVSDAIEKMRGDK